MALPINFTNLLNNRGYKSQSSVNMNSSLFPNHLLFKKLKKIFSNLYPPSGYCPFSFLSFTSISTFPLPIYSPVPCHGSSAPTIPLYLIRYFSVLLTAKHSLVTPFFYSLRLFLCSSSASFSLMHGPLP